MTASATSHATGVLDWLAANEQASVARLIDWLKIDSISTDPAYREPCKRAAEWAADHLRASGFDAKLMPTGTTDKPGHPIVLATTPAVHDANAKGPHILFYGHYDVQPVDPIELWESPPFEPVIKKADTECPDDRIIARGAVDDKGQVATFLEAMRAWKEVSGETAGGLKITVLLEGEEESGSVNLERFVRENAEMLKQTDVCLISDTGMLGRGKPAITYGVRGLSYTEVVLHGPNQDLHSGLWGGRVANPITELVRVLAQLHDENRHITIPNFYNGVRTLTQQERDNWAKLGHDQDAALKGIGMPPQGDIGEAGFSAIEREWARPTAEINGIIGGYTGKGAKTVIPSHASAKVSFRLVDDQDPAKITQAFFAWLDQRTPSGCRWEKIDHSGGLPATVATDSPLLAATMRALKAASNTEPALIKSGGSIPVAGLLKQTLGLETIFMGFGLDDDRVHSPNEKFELGCFRLGCRSHAMLVNELLAMQ
ncbi:MAG: M20/M25/M40 family metallo-hydrolase [Phycisphaeraceae bacterium]|nr:M20/M25/M40 family metallo-hydrolase [Phycisphaerales bacterium]MCB9860422.1 M20/M25/M40 family metallo-hydrolase [Phycisphaeraceae bacterium]